LQEGLAGAFATSVIKHEFRKEVAGTTAVFRDGDLIIQSSATKHSPTGVESIGNSLLRDVVDAASGLTLESVKNIADNLPKFEEHVTAMAEGLNLAVRPCIDIAWTEFEAAANSSPKTAG
jgi:hypothetical protein